MAEEKKRLEKIGDSFGMSFTDKVKKAFGIKDETAAEKRKREAKEKEEKARKELEKKRRDKFKNHRVKVK